MKLDTANNRQSNRHTDDNQERGGSGQSRFNMGFGIFNECFMTGAGELSSLTRITSRRFAGAQHISGETHAAKFIGMDSPRVISTGSGSRPGMNLLSSHANIKSVLNIDLINISPTNCDLVDGIANSDSFVKDDDFGMDKEPITGDRKCNSPENARPEIFAIGVEDGLKGEKNRTKNDCTSEKVTTSRPKDFSVGHDEIFSRKVA